MFRRALPGDSIMNPNGLYIPGIRRIVFGRHGRGRAGDLAFRAALIMLLLAVFLPLAQAQVSASIKGNVTDASGAAVPAVTVIVKNIETGAIRSGVTDDAGRYLVLSLHVGEYEVRVSKTGFQEAIRSGIYLVVGQEASIDVQLQIG